RLPDLAVIDISLEDEPEGGFELCRQLRALSAELPIIFLTARDSELDAVSGLRLGADDFLTKDLSLAHLIARVNALFRRVDALRRPDTPGEIVRRGALTLDAERMQAQWDGRVVLLSLTEFWIVHALARHWYCPGADASTRARWSPRCARGRRTRSRRSPRPSPPRSRGARIFCIVKHPRLRMLPKRPPMRPPATRSCRAVRTTSSPWR